MVKVEKKKSMYILRTNQTDFSKQTKNNQQAFDSIFIARPSFLFKPFFEKKNDEKKTSLYVAKETGLSHDFVQRLINYEGFLNKEYADPAGVRTIGVGHNIDVDKNYKLGKSLSNDQVYELLIKDLKEADRNIKYSVKPAQLNIGQKEALLDLFFNVGAKKLSNSKLLSHIKNKNFDEATAEINFISSNHKIFAGLCQRRIEDIDSFSAGRLNQKSLKLVKSIYSKGLVAFDQLIKKASGEKKEILIKKKAVFVNESTHLINNNEPKHSTTKHKK